MANPAPDDWLFNGPPVPATEPTTLAPVAQSLLPPKPQPAPAGGGSGMAINNPLNLRPIPGGQWQGQAGVSPAGFATFPDPVSGWNAADQNLQAKVTRHGLTTIAGIIGDPTNGWAPASDNNDPASYAAKVAAGLGVKPTDDISRRLTTDANFRHQMLEQMAAVETGSPQKFGGAPGDQAPPAGMSDAELKEWLGLQAPAATTPAGQAPAATKQFTVGPNSAAPTAAQEAFYKAHYPQGGDNSPYALQSGGPIPQTPGAHYVDLDGNEHVVPGGFVKIAENALAGLGQAFGPDVANSANRMTGGGMATAPGPSIMPSGNPMFGAFAGMQPGALAQQQQMAQASLAGGAAQQRRYAFEHAGDQSAQAGRATGQVLLGTGAAALVPEADATGLAGLATKAGVNALRGAMATAPSVGANPQNVGLQLATGAGVGLASPLLELPAKGAQAVTGLGRTVTPDVAALADTAQSKYGMRIASGQIGNTDAKVAYSQMLKTDPKLQAQNAAQRQQWMKGVTSTYGDPTGDISPPALAANRATIGAAIGGAADRVGTIDASAVPDRLDGIAANASQDIGFDGSKQLKALVQRIKGAIQPDGTMPASAYKDITDHASPLMTAVQAGEHPYAGQIKEALDDALENSADPADVADLRNNRWQYKNLMTVAKAAKNQNNIGPDGVFTPAALNTATTSNFKNRAFQGAGDLDELNAIRKHIMTEPSDSGTAGRLKDLALPMLGAGAVGAAGDTAAFLLQHPEGAFGTLSGAALGATTKLVGDALKRNKVAGNAAGIVARSLPGAPRPVIENALSGLRKIARPVEIPLSALAGVRGLQTFAPSPAIAAP